jgi:hypothetical protein
MRDADPKAVGVNFLTHSYEETEESGDAEDSEDIFLEVTF